MNKSIIILSSIALTLGVISIVPASEEGPMHMMNGMRGMHGMGGMKGMHNNPQQHLNEMKKTLNLTSKQKPLWNTFEKTVIAQSKTMKAMHEKMQGNGHAMHPGNMDQMDARFAGMKKVHAAKKALFDALTGKQKKSLEDQSFGHHG